MKKKILLFLLINFSLYGQISVSQAGGYIGGGLIFGNTPKISSFTFSLFMDVAIDGVNLFAIRPALHYGRDMEAFLPGDQLTGYYPFVQGVSIKAVTFQPVDQWFFLEAAGGLLYLNDRTLISENNDTFGMAASAAIGLNLSGLGISYTGFVLCAGAEYALAVYETQAQLVSVHLQAQYRF